MSFGRLLVSWPASPTGSLHGRCRRRSSIALALSERRTKARTVQWKISGRRNFHRFGIARRQLPRQLRDRLPGLCARSVCQLSGALGVSFDVTRSSSLSSAGCGNATDVGGSSSGVAASATSSVAVFPARRGQRRSPVCSETFGTVSVPAFHASGLAVSATSSPQNELEYLKSGVFLGFVVYRKNRLASCGVIATPHCAVRIGWGPVVPGVCTVHRLVLTPTVTTFEHHAALCPPIKFLLVAEETGCLIRDL